MFCRHSKIQVSYDPNTYTYNPIFFYLAGAFCHELVFEGYGIAGR